MKLLTTPEAAERLRVSISRVQSLIWGGRLPAEKLGRDYVIKEEDLEIIIDREPSRRLADLETPMIERYWRKLGKGILLLEFAVIERDKPQTRGRRTVDAVIINSDKQRKIERGGKTSLTGEDVIVIEANRHRLGMGLMGQAVFAPKLVKRHKPKSVSSIALCSATDPFLRPLLKPFRDVEIVIDTEVSASPEPKLAPRDKNKIERFWRKERGILIDNYPLVKRADSSGPHILHAVILKNKRLHHLSRKREPLEGEDVIILHTTPKRLSPYVMGIALFSAQLVMLEKPKSVRSIILCGANDSALQPLLAPYPYVEVVPDRD
jgi:excisionase family DNA binding protein